MSTTLTCPRCRTTYSIGVTFENVSFSGNAQNVVAPCPNCHHEFDAAPGDGTYSTVGGRLRRVADYIAEADTNALVDLQQRLSDAQRSHDAEAAARALAAVGLDPGRGLRNQANRMELWQVLGVLLGVLAVVLGMRSANPGTGMTPEEVARLIGDQVEKQGGGGPEKNHVRKVGRNELCPCGSGAKYKRCHGAHPSARPD